MEKFPGPHPQLLLTRSLPQFQYPAYGALSTCRLDMHRTGGGRVLLALRDVPENTGVPLFRSKAEAYQQACLALAEVQPDPSEVQVVMTDRWGQHVLVQCQEDVFGRVTDLTAQELPLGVDDTDV